MRVNSIRSKIVLGFLACIAVTVIAFGVILTVALDFRQADALSRQAVDGTNQAAAVQKAAQAAETALMQYLSTVNGANRKELGERLSDLTRIDPAYQSLADEADAASRLIENAQVGVISIANMVNALSAPTMTIGEAAANLGDAAIAQSVIKYNQSYAQVASNIGRVFALQDNGAAEFVAQNIGRMETNLAEIVGQPVATPRVKKLGAAIDRDSKALGAAFADYRKLVRQRDDAMARLKQSLGAVSDAAATKAAHAAEDYGRTQRVAETATTRLMISLFSGAPAVLIIGLVLAFSIGRSISRPVVALSGTVEKIATGDYEIEVPGQERGDEIGQMAKAVRVLKEGAVERRRLQAEQSREAEARLRRAETIDTLLRDFATDSTRVIEGFRRAAGDLDGMARKLAENSSDTSARAMATSAAATQASTNVVAVARAAEQLRLSIEEINTKVTGSAAAADRASTLAGDTVRTIAELAEAGTEIGEVVSLITAVASQTNLLALNATIEAARAGEAGRGFAVVATEVKNLAAQTTAATAQISEKVSRIQNITMAASGAVEAIRNAISDIDQMSGGIAAAMTEQGAATDEIARGMDEAAKGTEDVTANVAMVSSRADDVRDASRHSLDATAELASQASHLSGRIDDFLGRIRAA